MNMKSSLRSSACSIRFGRLHRFHRPVDELERFPQIQKLRSARRTSSLCPPCEKRSFSSLIAQFGLAASSAASNQPHLFYTRLYSTFTNLSSSSACLSSTVQRLLDFGPERLCLNTHIIEIILAGCLPKYSTQPCSKEESIANWGPVTTVTSGCSDSSRLPQADRAGVEWRDVFISDLPLSAVRPSGRLLPRIQLERTIHFASDRDWEAVPH